MPGFIERHSRTIKYAIITVALFFYAGVITASGFVMGYALFPAVKEDGVVYIPTGSTYAAQRDSLDASGLVRNIKRYDRYARIMKLDKKAMPGRYELKKGMKYKELISMISLGKQSPINMVVRSNVRTKERLAAVMSRYVECDSLEVLTLLRSDSAAASYGFDRNTFIAMFIPNTYQVYWNTSPSALLSRMKKEYDRFWNEERTEKLAARGLSKIEAVTLASIVAEETNKADEMPRMAGLYLNRIRIGMPLQADPTVRFAIGDFTIKRVLYSHLKFESPYNTYLHRGLPPGPICIPPITAIEAVLNSEKNDYLYFCVKPDFSGYHDFTNDYDVHTRNARAYARALNARGIR